MFVPLTAMDFLDRAASVYGDKAGIIDEPDQPADSQGTLTYGRVAELASRQAARLDELGIAAGERVAIISHNSSRLLVSFFGVSGWGRVLVPINFRLRPDEVQYIVDHSGARVLYVDPELADSLADVDCEHKFVGRRALRRFRPGSSDLGRRRKFLSYNQLHIWHDRATERRRAHPSKYVDQRRHLRPPHDNQ
jgi:acyl-CoA synthetase (AMP-forming)/AMP-acid ligase II